MRKQVRLFDVCHWQLKRCVTGSLCEVCSQQPDSASGDTVQSRLSVDSDDHRQPLTHIAGIDISFVKNDHVNACAACVVMRLPEFDVRIPITTLSLLSLRNNYYLV